MTAISILSPDAIMGIAIGVLAGLLLADGVKALVKTLWNRWVQGGKP